MISLVATAPLHGALPFPDPIIGLGVGQLGKILFGHNQRVAQYKAAVGTEGMRRYLTPAGQIRGAKLLRETEENGGLLLRRPLPGRPGVSERNLPGL